MAGFEVISDKDDSENQLLPASGLTTTVGDLLERVAGSTTWAACTSSSDWFTVKAIAMEAVSSANRVLAYRIKGNELVKVDAANSSDSADNGDRMILTDKDTVANTGSDVTGQSPCFIQEGVLGVTGDKKIIGKIIVGNGIDPDASG